MKRHFIWPGISDETNFPNGMKWTCEYESAHLTNTPTEYPPWAWLCVSHTHTFFATVWLILAIVFLSPHLFRFAPNPGALAFVALIAACCCCCLLLLFYNSQTCKNVIWMGKKERKKTKSNDALTQLDSRSRCYFHFVGIGVCTFCTNVTMQKRKATSKRIAQLISIYLIDVIFIHLFIFLLFCCSNFFSLSFF